VKKIQRPGQFFPAPTDKGGRLLESDSGLILDQGAGFGLAEAFHHHPAGQDQGLGLGPTPGQTPPYQELIEAGFGFAVCGFQFSVSYTRCQKFFPI
jgi:hypothetical protein